MSEFKRVDDINCYAKNKTALSTVFVAVLMTFVVICIFGDNVAYASGVDDIVTTWQTTNINDTIIIPGTGTYMVDWGDNSTTSETDIATHQYASPGTYTIRISGELDRFWLGDSNSNSANDRKIKSIEQWGNITWNNMNGAFRGATNIMYNATDAPDLSSVTDVGGMFQGAFVLNGDLSNWNTSMIIYMNDMFSSARAFDGNISGWDTSNVIDTSDMFSGAIKFNQPLNMWDTSNINNMGNMFNSATDFDQDLSLWNVSSVTNMKSMFSNADKFNQDLLSWDTSNVINMGGLFFGTVAFDGNVSSWDTSSVTDMSGMFAGTENFNQRLLSWDVSKVVNMHGMFAGNGVFDQNLTLWDVSKVTNMGNMFTDTGFNGDISKWNTLNVTDMSNMFNNANSFNSDITEWDTSNVTDMFNMFRDATAFNQDISNWDVSAVDYMQNMFMNASVFEQNLGKWYILLDYNSIIPSHVPGIVGEISAQNTVLKNHNPTYNIGESIDKDYFEIVNNSLNMTSMDAGKNSYIVNITATGSDVFENGNNWRLFTIIVDSTSFVTTWQTTRNDDSIIIPGTGTYMVDWGDSSTTLETDIATHQYASTGTYTVSISGELKRFWLGDISSNSANDRKIKSIKQWGNTTWSSMNGAFRGATNIMYNATDAPDLSGVTDISGMFQGAFVLNGDLSNWNTSTITNMKDMFSSARTFNGNISKWYTSGVVDMGGMFNGAVKFNQTVNMWDTSSVNDMSDMFNSATDFDQDLSLWNVSNVVNMKSMFSGAIKFNQDLSLWNVSSVVNMGGMFFGTDIFNNNISGWDTSSVTDMSGMFAGTDNFNQRLLLWNVSKVINMNGMFAGNGVFNQNLTLWDVSSVTNMGNMFTDTGSFNGDISKWDTLKVTDMSNMFNDANSFDSDITMWNTSSVIDMFNMFRDATTFNQDISNWDVSAVDDMQNMFMDASAFEQNLGKWYIVLDRNSIIPSYVPGIVGEISAQNTPLNNHIPIYGIGESVDSDHFKIINNNINMTSVNSGQNAYIINITAIGSNVFENGNNWIIINITTDTTSFATTWRTDSDNQSIYIPVHSDMIYNYTIVWGDGTTDTDVIGNAVHRYITAGNYQVKIYGTYPGIYLNGHVDASKLISIDQWGNNHWKSMNSAFMGASNMVYNTVDIPNLSSVTDTSSMFYGASTFNGDISSWDVSTVTDMSSMFRSALAFNQNISTWDVSAVTNMSWMFSNTTLFNQPLNDWDVSNVIDMSSIFHDAQAFNQPLNDWDVSAVSDMNNMFRNIYQSPFNQYLNDWDVSTVTDMSNMFNGAASFNRQLNDWDVSNVINMRAMFNDASSFNRLLNDWDVSNVSDMQIMFKSAVKFNQPLNNWNVSSVKHMYNMFDHATAFNQNLGNWYIVQNSASIISSDIPGTLTIIFAQNQHLDDQIPIYGIGRSLDENYFGISNNHLNMTSMVAGRDSYIANITATGTNVFESENNWRIIKVHMEDRTGPIPHISTTSPPITNAGSIPVLVNFNKQINATTFTISDVNTTNGMSDSLTHISGNTTFEFVLVPDSDGKTSVTIPANRIDDIFGNANTESNELSVIFDTVGPTINIIGDQVVSISVDSIYMDLGATCTDLMDVSPTLTSESTVDTSSVGEYTVTYSCIDASGNSTTVSRTVTVEDTTPPTIMLIGSVSIMINTGVMYEDLGATCTDMVDDSPILTSQSTVDTSDTGTYMVVYSCVDNSNNFATQVSRTVIVEDATPPTIMLVGSDSVIINAGVMYEDLGATCTDLVDDSPTLTSESTVDTSNVGIYMVTYSCIDNSGNSATQVSRTVTVRLTPDNTPPTIRLVGSDSVTINTGVMYNDMGAICTDLVDDSPTLTSESTVDTSDTGTYTVVYSCVDNSGNSATVSRTVTVEDDTPPTIMLVGSDSIMIIINATYNDLGAICTDLVDDSPTLTSESSVDTSSVGEYIVTYSCVDNSGNSATLIRTVTVISTPDNTPPIIRLVGSDSVTINTGVMYEDLGATCTDLVDDSPTLTSESTVDTGNIGEYIVTYSCVDGSGNSATQVSRTVIVEDTTPPTIMLVGSASIMVNTGVTYNDLGAICTDLVDDSPILTSENSVDANNVGEYTVTYSCLDNSGNSATVLRTVIVKDDTPPTIMLIGSDSITITINGAYNELGATCVDKTDGDLTDSITITTDMNTLISGTYHTTYTCMDSANNSVYVIRNIIVTTSEDIPVINIVGDVFISMPIDTEFINPDATCSDETDGDLTGDIIITTTVDTSIAGTYHIIYTCTDSVGNTVQENRVVIVIDESTIPIDPRSKTWTVNDLVNIMNNSKGHYNLELVSQCSEGTTLISANATMHLLGLLGQASHRTTDINVESTWFWIIDAYRLIAHSLDTSKDVISVNVYDYGITLDQYIDASHDDIFDYHDGNSYTKSQLGNMTAWSADIDWDGEGSCSLDFRQETWI